MPLKESKRYMACVENGKTLRITELQVGLCVMGGLV